MKYKVILELGDLTNLENGERTTKEAVKNTIINALKDYFEEGKIKEVKRIK